MLRLFRPWFPLGTKLYFPCPLELLCLLGKAFLPNTPLSKIPSPYILSRYSYDMVSRNSLPPLRVLVDYNTNFYNLHMVNLGFPAFQLFSFFSLETATVLSAVRQVFQPFLQFRSFWHLFFSKSGPSVLQFEVNMSRYSCFSVTSLEGSCKMALLGL